MASGKVVQVIGTVVDVEFPPDQLPAVYNAIEIDNNGETVIAEVQQHLGNNWVRSLTMTSTDGLRRGANAVDTGAAIRVPVGPNTLGRLFDVLFPALEFFNMGPAIIRETPLDLWQFGGYALTVFGYSIIYTSIALLVGLLLFEDRDLA